MSDENQTSDTDQTRFDNENPTGDSGPAQVPFGQTPSEQPQQPSQPATAAYGASAFQPTGPQFGNAPQQGQHVPANGQAPQWGAPQQPGGPGQPVPSQFGGPGQPGWQGQPGAPMPQFPNQKPKKGLPTGAIIGIVVAAVVVVALILAVVLGRGLGKLSADDYSDGSNTINTMQKKYYRIDTEISDIYTASYSSGKKVDDEDVAKVKKLIKEYQDANTQFGQLKIMRDQKVKDGYGKYSAKAKKYTQYASKIADSAIPMVKASLSCSKAPTVSDYDSDFYSKYDTYISTCQSDLDALSNAPDKAISDYASSLGDYISKLSDLIGKMKAIGDPSKIEYGSDAYNQYRDLQDQFYDLPSIYDTVDTFQQDMKDEEDNANPTDELKDLSDIVQDGFDEAVK